MKSAKIRQSFLEYFQQHGHTLVPSSSLIPTNDPTLLFTNAGMVQFKEVFLGLETRNYDRAVSAQCCVRAGGKHNDLENVGYTVRHHTFFEMLGNFSFGAYFKREAIHYAWDFLTNVLLIPVDKLWVTVFHDDQESEQIWLNDIKIAPERIRHCGEKDNFWSMGETGPCGPCSEIFYDHGPSIAGGPPGSPEQEGDRYVEIWNLVFMQYQRHADGSLTALPKPAVDTGMGLERISAVLQGVHDNYDTDLFVPLLDFVARLANQPDRHAKSMRVIADHIRSSAFLITDGVLPSNEGRGYVLRRLIRRAVRHGHKLGLNETFLYKLVTPLIAIMGDAYPELKAFQQRIEMLLTQEEEQFVRTLDNGLNVLEAAMAQLQTDVLDGELVFRLYDTYGFPSDLTADIARERGLTVDREGFARAKQRQQEISREASQFKCNYTQLPTVSGKTEFTGYDTLQHKAEVMQCFYENSATDVLQQGQHGALVLSKTPFYAESGGQVGDQGRMYFAQGIFIVNDTQKQGDAYLHYGQLQSGTICVGDELMLEVDVEKRQATALNHSATHLLHAALRQILGPHVTQKGSLVEAARLRFDFSHQQPLTPTEIAAIEALVNEKIQQGLSVHTREMALREAKELGAMALFGEKYADRVRVLSMGDFSVEICGGTHVTNSHQIGLFKITAETGTAAGIRRLEAVTGLQAWQWLATGDNQLQQIMALINADRSNVVSKLEQLLKQRRDDAKQLAQLQQKLASQSGQALSAQAQSIAGVNVLAVQLPTVDIKAMRDTLDQLKQTLKAAVLVLASVDGDKIRLIAGVTKAQTAQIKAGELVNYVAQQVGGRGGGRADMAQAGGTQVANLAAALESVYPWVAKQLQQG